MTVSSCAGSRSSDVLNDKKFGTISKQATGRAKPAANLPKSLEPTPIVAEHGAMRREINISGNQLLVACLAWIYTSSHSPKFLGAYGSFFPTPCRIYLMY